MSGWSEITVIKKTTIDVAGVDVEIEINVPISVRLECEICGDEMDFSVDYDNDGDAIIKAECKCMVEPND